MKKNETDNELNQLLQNAFSDYRVQADEEVWTGIEQALQREKKRRIVWWPYAAAASVALLVTLTVLLNREETNGYNAGIETSSTAQQQETPVATEINSLPEESQLSSAEPATAEPGARMTSVAKNEPSRKTQPVDKTRTVKEELPIENQSIADNKSKNLPVQPEKQNESPVIINAPVTPQPGQNSDVAEISNEEKNNIVTPDSEEKAVEQMEVVTANSPDSVTPEKVYTADDIDLGINYENEDQQEENSNWFLAANVQSNSGSEVNGREYPSANGKKLVEKFGMFTTTGTNSGPLVTDTDTIEVNNVLFGSRSFTPPISTSITANYALSKRWSLESGLSLSILGSMQESTDQSKVKVKQREQLYYIGIPLYLNYNCITRKKVSAFVSTGLVVNKGISHVTRSSFENDSIENQVQREGIDGIKYVIYAGVGVEYRFIPLIGLFVQPGMSYYSSTKQQPFDIGGNRSTGTLPDLRFGLRFHLNSEKQ